MTEQGYQSKIIKALESIGGVAINGNFTKAGTADLICGYPVKTILRHLHVEVKTKIDYYRVMRSIKEIEGVYVFNDDTKSLKPHEYLQITKLNKIRSLGGLAVLAYEIDQVHDYVASNT